MPIIKELVSIWFALNFFEKFLKTKIIQNKKMIQLDGFVVNVNFEPNFWQSDKSTPFWSQSFLNFFQFNWGFFSFFFVWKNFWAKNKKFLWRKIFCKKIVNSDLIFGLFLFLVYFKILLNFFGRGSFRKVLEKFCRKIQIKSWHKK